MRTTTKGGMMYRIKVENFYEVEAENIEEITASVDEYGIVNNEKLDYVGSYYFVEEIQEGKPKDWKHYYVQMDW